VLCVSYYEQKEQQQKRFQSLSIVVAFFPPFLTMRQTVLSLTAFLFVVMKNGLSVKRTESCLCCTRNTVIKMFQCKGIVS